MKIRSTENRTFGLYLLRNAKGCILLLILSLAVPLLTAARETIGVEKPVPTATLTDISASQQGGTLTVTLKTNGVPEPKTYMLDNPPRLVLDFQNTVNKVPFMKLPLNAAPARQLRVSQFRSADPRIARVVFDLAKKPIAHRISLNSSSVMVTLESKQTSTDKAPVTASDESATPSTAPGTTDSAPVPVATTPVDAGTASGRKASDRAKISVVKSGNPEPEARIAEASSSAKPASAEKSSDKAATSVKADSGSSPATTPEKTVEKPENPQQKPSGNSSASETREKPALIAALQSNPPSLPKSAAETLKAQPKTTGLSPSSRFSGQLLTLDFVDLPLVDFFRVMSEEAGINIVLDPKVKGSISLKVDKLPWDQIFDSVLVNNSLDKQIEGNLIRVAYKSTIQEEAKQREALKKAQLLAADLETRVTRLNYAKADALIGALNDLKTVRGTVVHDERTNSLVLTDIPSSIDKMMDLIKTLDIPQPQVEIEARIVSAARDFARDIGVQFGFVKGNLERVTVGGPNTFGTIGGTRPSATPKSTYAAGNDLTGRGAASGNASESGAVSTGEAGNYNVNLPASKAFGGVGISIGNIFDTFLLDAALTAGESKGLAKLISQPKVTAQNNSPAVISQGTRFPVLVRANNTTTVQFYNAALTLTVTPQITYEGNIVMDLKVENNTADWGRTVESVPSIRISESQSRVLVSDGGTTVIGGILIDEDSNSGDKVPGLGDLPLVGNLFRRTSVSRTSQEVLFFVTPRIVK